MMSHNQIVERASLDPEFEFMGLDGCLTAYVSKETGCIIFPKPTGSLSPHNVSVLVRFLIERSNAMPFLAECQGKKEFDKNSG